MLARHTFYLRLVFFFLSSSSSCVYSYTADIIKHLQLAQFFFLLSSSSSSFRLPAPFTILSNCVDKFINVSFILTVFYICIFIPFLYEFFFSSLSLLRWAIVLMPFFLMVYSNSRYLTVQKIIHKHTQREQIEQ